MSVCCVGPVCHERDLLFRDCRACKPTPKTCVPLKHRSDECSVKGTALNGATETLQVVALHQPQRFSSGLPVCVLSNSSSSLALGESFSLAFFGAGGFFFFKGLQEDVAGTRAAGATVGTAGFDSASCASSALCSSL